MLAESLDILSKFQRISGGKVLPQPDSIVSIRLKMMSMKVEGGLPGAFHLSMYCAHCRAHHEKPEITVVEGSSYENVYEIILGAMVCAKQKNITFESQTNCGRCQSALYKFFDYHHYFAEHQQDLVVRLATDPTRPQFPSYQLLWMNLSGQLREATERDIPTTPKEILSAIIEQAITSLRRGDLDACAKTTLYTMRNFPGAPELVSLGFALIDTSKRGVAEAIGQQQAELNPGSADGQALLAQICLRGYAESGGTLTELLDAGHDHAKQALAINPFHSEALLSYANSLRLCNADPQLVTAAFKELISKAPDYAQAYYNYGLHCLVFHPDEAPAVFAHGHALAPSDGDYLVKQALALCKIGRKKDAEQVLREARKLAPNHPQIPSIAREIGSLN